MCVGFKKGIEYLETQNINCDKILVSGPSAGAHLASLLCYSQNRIPMLLIHSKHDGLIDYSMSEKFYEKSQTLGMECELYEVTDKINTHSAYSAGMFLETRETNKALNKLFAWIENL